MSTPVTPATVRAHANLPPEVPEALLAEHIAIAGRDTIAAAGVDAAPLGFEDLWSEAVTVRALASVFPWLNTFALDGAARVGRLEGAVEARFLDADEVEARITKLDARFHTLIAKLPKADTPEDDATVNIQDTWMTVI